MRVIADASPLRYLILIGHVDLLSTLFSQIIVPRAVADELQQPNTPPVVRQWMQHCLLGVSSVRPSRGTPRRWRNWAPASVKPYCSPKSSRRPLCLLTKTKDAVLRVPLGWR